MMTLWIRGKWGGSVYDDIVLDDLYVPMSTKLRNYEV